MADRADVGRTVELRLLIVEENFGHALITMPRQAFRCQQKACVSASRSISTPPRAPLSVTGPHSVPRQLRQTTGHRSTTPFWETTFLFAVDFSCFVAH